MQQNIKPADFIYPYFVAEGVADSEELGQFPGVRRFSIGALLEDMERTARSGVGAVLLFGVPAQKDPTGSGAYDERGIVCSAVRALKKEYPDMTVMTDVCLCAYTSHGHCGLIASDDHHAGRALIDTDGTLQLLARTAEAHAAAGADWVAPSAMTQGQVAAIRRALDAGGMRATRILGYSAKFSSVYYGPFRFAADSAPRFGDRRGYQLDCADTSAAMREIADDIGEGADMVMVKPALCYLDVIRQARDRFAHPLCAYSVSGEYAMIRLGARQGWWQERAAVEETVCAIRRAGADTIITYHARDIAEWIRSGG